MVLCTITAWTRKHFAIICCFCGLYLPVPPIWPCDRAIEAFGSQTRANIRDRNFHPGFNFAGTLWLFLDLMVRPEARSSLVLRDYLLDGIFDLILAERALSRGWIFGLGFISGVENFSLSTLVGRSRGKFTFFLTQRIHLVLLYYSYSYNDKEAKTQ